MLCHLNVPWWPFQHIYCLKSPVSGPSNQSWGYMLRNIGPLMCYEGNFVLPQHNKVSINQSQKRAYWGELGFKSHLAISSLFGRGATCSMVRFQILQLPIFGRWSIFVLCHSDVPQAWEALRRHASPPPQARAAGKRPKKFSFSQQWHNPEDCITTFLLPGA